MQTNVSAKKKKKGKKIKKETVLTTKPMLWQNKVLEVMHWIMKQCDGTF